MAATKFWQQDVIADYESTFAGEFANNHGVMFAHGRSGLYALLKIWGLENQEIICPAYTCVVVADAIVLAGSTPVFVDCEPDRANMSLAGIEQAITEKTRAIVATHLFGYPMDVIEINAIVREAEQKYGHKIYVIQDCAHSYGAKWQNQLVTEFGDAAIFGCNISKIINSIFGGMVTTNSNDTAQRLRTWRELNSKKHPLSKTLKRAFYLYASSIAFNENLYGLVNYMDNRGWLGHFTQYYEEGIIRFPSDWDQAPVAIEARVGLEQLQKYADIVTSRRQRALHIKEALTVIDDLRFFEDIEGSTYSHLVARVEDRQRWVNRTRLQGLQLGILIEYSVPEMQAYQKFKRSEYPVAKQYSKHCINFPLHRDWLTSHHINKFLNE
jgi:dTDP-4-amino-4,6-dideoxygalactose transaminase